MSSNNPTAPAQEEDIQPLKFDVDTAIEELGLIIDSLSDMYYQLKKVKYDYLVHTSELFSRIDFPSLMMEDARREIKGKIPSAKTIEKMEF